MRKFAALLLTASVSLAAPQLKSKQEPLDADRLNRAQVVLLKLDPKHEPLYSPQIRPALDELGISIRAVDPMKVAIEVVPPGGTTLQQWERIRSLPGVRDVVLTD